MRLIGGQAGALKFDTSVRNALKLAEDAPALAYAAELKFDGLAINLRYEAGVLVQAIDPAAATGLYAGRYAPERYQEAGGG